MLNLVYVALVVAILILLNYATGPLVVLQGRRGLARACKGKLVLTYDDGPRTNTTTERLLEILDTYDAKATFFCVGFRVKDAPDQCEYIHGKGHEIGAHGFRHLNARRNPIRCIWDTRDGFEAVAPWLGGLRPFRPPFGKITLLSWIVVKRAAARSVFWTLDTRDWSDAPPSVDELLAKAQQDGGAVVLLHDHDSLANPRQAEFMLEVTRKLLELARRRGWRACTTSDALS